MDDLELIRDLGRELEHEPDVTLLRQRKRLLDAASGRGGRRGPGRWTLLGTVAAVAAAVVTAAAILVPTVLLDGRARPAASRTAPGLGKTLNVLLIGSDARNGGSQARADTLVLMHVPANRKDIRAVSIPRDTLVSIPECKDSDGKTHPAQRGQVNAAFSLGGAECALKTVESLTRVRVDQTLTVDFGGFKGMVDALGGVDVTLPRSVDDRQSGLKLSPGRHRLNGTQALAYVRVRHGLGDGSDLDRVKRQQKFMASLVHRAKEQRWKSPVRFAKFLAAVAGSVKSSPQWDVRALEALAATFDGTDVDDVGFRTLPVRPAPNDPARLVVDTKAAERVFAPFRK
ncbi:hypothetical protein GCM10022254_45750 [Actinomadura meridiana]|uniref:Cell envelope-related transcriptional attenuator domain-containing protein n=1 Tax=Actinomadura meridiana TaxID=559626 RepID=A0ABP8CA74_9ACTN